MVKENKSETVVLKPGPVSKYTPELCNKIYEVAAQGGHIAEMMVATGIKSKDTWYRWQTEHPEFKKAVEYAKIVSQAHYEKVGYLGATGQINNFNASAYALIMNNKFKDEYSRSGGGSNTEITINQLSLNNEQIDQKIAQKLEKLKSLGVDLEPATRKERTS